MIEIHSNLTFYPFLISELVRFWRKLYDLDFFLENWSPSPTHTLSIGRHFFICQPQTALYRNIRRTGRPSSVSAAARSSPKEALIEFRFGMHRTFPSPATTFYSSFHYAPRFPVNFRPRDSKNKKKRISPARIWKLTPDANFAGPWRPWKLPWICLVMWFLPFPERYFTFVSPVGRRRRRRRLGWCQLVRHRRVLFPKSINFGCPKISSNRNAGKCT